jgi:hypothetical protein
MSLFFGISQQKFSPLIIPNCKQWLGDYVNSGTKRTTLSNGANINSWDDLSGNANHLNAKGGQPIYATALNSINFVSNTGSFLGSTTKSPFTSAVCTIFQIHAEGDTSINAGYPLWFGKQTTNGGNMYMNFIIQGGYLSQQGVTLTNRSWLNLNAQNYHLTTLIQSGVSHTCGVFRKNGAVVTVNAAGGAGNYTTFASTMMLFGYIDSAGTLTAYGTRGSYQELIVYDRALNINEITAVESYLNKKYAIY